MSFNEQYLKAGKIAAEVREESRAFVKVGAKLLDIADKIESLIKKKGAQTAFPVNLSLNDIGAHYTPTKNDETVIGEADLIKVDIGVHVDGYIGDTAYTISFDEKHNKLVEASQKALEEAIRLCVPGALLSDVSKKIEDVIKSYGFNPISNLSGHGLEEYNLHAEPQIPNVSFNSDYKLREGQVIAIEPFATDGAGMIKESDKVMIFRLFQAKPVRNQDAKKIIAFAESFHGMPFAERWIDLGAGKLDLIKIKLALRELRMKNILYDYPVLREVKGGTISQAEHTIIVADNPIITTEHLSKSDNKNKKLLE